MRIRGLHKDCGKRLRLLFWMSGVCYEVEETAALHPINKFYITYFESGPIIISVYLVIYRATRRHGGKHLSRALLRQTVQEFYGSSNNTVCIPLKHH